ncbi:hypothetical protein [Nitrospira sp. Kam-Ns4a]
MLRPGLVLLGLLAGAVCSLFASAGEERALQREALVGTWGCQSVYGGPFTGRSCRTWPQLTLSADGTYTWGSEQGTWEIGDRGLHLSARTGVGRLEADGRLVVEYEVKGTQYRQVLFKR